MQDTYLRRDFFSALSLTHHTAIHLMGVDLTDVYLIGMRISWACMSRACISWRVLHGGVPHRNTLSGPGFLGFLVR